MTAEEAAQPRCVAWEPTDENPQAPSLGTQSRSPGATAGALMSFWDTLRRMVIAARRAVRGV